jgi:hypothetical protein
MAGCLLGCQALTKQTFTNEHGNYYVVWRGRNICQLEYFGEPSFAGAVMVKVTHDGSHKVVAIGSSDGQLWSHDTFVPRQHRGTSSGVKFAGESHYKDSLRTEVQEWKAEKTDIVIYKEIVVEDGSGNIVRHEFFGPFEVPLKLH